MNISMQGASVRVGLLAAASSFALTFAVATLRGIAMPNKAHAFECGNVGAGTNSSNDGGVSTQLACGENANASGCLLYTSDAADE